MKLRHAVTLAALSSLATGTVVHTLRAQASPPVYVVVVNEVLNQEGYLKEYLPTALKTLKDHGAVIVAAGPGIQIDGTFPKGRVSIQKWESMDALLQRSLSAEIPRRRNPRPCSSDRLPR